ncbi:MAG TPA: ABC-F family ATP-binding cassette domain-containing protein [Polyangia bacterium]|nr:ABC-F family ATP-binding cassette domain-containing protein [Polyangia bacterium]
MSILLSVQELSAAFGARPLFEGVSFTIEEGERIGLIGPNGAGKSTLLRILADDLGPDRGAVSRRRGLRVARLAQVPRFAAGASVQSAVTEGLAPAGDHLDEASAEIGRATIAALGLDGRAEASVAPETPVETLSGGWQKRVALARELARQPDLLLLDEPTNHLDVEGIELLETLLGRAPFATITITHDRVFLQRISTRILELDRRNAGGMLSVAGDYAAYTRAKAEQMHAQERREVVLRNTLRRETEWLRRGAAARTTKQEARIQRAGALSDEVDELGRRNLTRTAGLDFQAAEKRPRRLIEARGLGQRYGERTIFQGVDLFIGPGTRLGLLGPNGCGKSTLLRLLLGVETPTTGTVLRADGLKVAYFQQTRDALDPDRTLADTLSPDGDHVTFRGARVHVRGYLERFLFDHEQMNTPVGRLSGGEQSRLLLAMLMLREAQVLVLDEPTNDLDLPTLAVLEEALTGFDGAVLLVTHDRYFLDQVATTILAFDTAAGAVVPFADVAQWEGWRAARLAAAREAAKPRDAQAPSGGKPSAPARRKLGYQDQREYDAIEETIARAEAALREAITDSERPEHAADAARLVALLADVDARRAEVDRLYARWAELEAKREGTPGA